MTPFHTESRFTLYVGNSLDVMPTLPPSSVDSIVSDPPYGLSFMGKDWDHGVPGEAFWREALRVAKPGAHLLAFGGTRTFHRLAVAIEDAGWEIRDCVMWVYGSGFPKSHDVSKAIDKAAGAEREVIKGGGRSNIGTGARSHRPSSFSQVLTDSTNERTVRNDLSLPATDLAKQWEGWGTALKPAWEPVIVARKPLEGTVAENVLKYGTGGINVNGCRVGYDSNTEDTRRKPIPSKGWCIGSATSGSMDDSALKGRWPANVIHDGSEEVVAFFPATTSGKPGDSKRTAKGMVLQGGGNGTPLSGYGDSGSAARFFYCAKAGKADRDDGCEDLPEKLGGAMSGKETRPDRPPNHTMRANHHPTVKPTDLMRYLVRLVTPPGGVVLDPFMGSGSTGRGALLEGCRFVGIDLSDEYATIARERIAACAAEPSLFDAVS